MFVDGLQQGNLLQIVSDPKGRFVFTMRQEASSFGMPVGFSGISSFQINSQTGALTLAPNSPIIFGTNANTASIVFDGLGRWIYQPRMQSPSGFDIYAIDQTSGALSKLPPSNVTPIGGASVGSPDGRFLFDSGGGKVQTLTVDSSGQLSVVAITAILGGGAGPIAVSADGKFLYSSNSAEGTVAVLSIGTDGKLTAMGGSPFHVSAGSDWIALTPDGKFLYSLSSAGVEGFALNPSAGTFAPIAGFSPIAATAFTLDRAGKFAFVSDINATNPVLTTFSINPTTGAFTKLSRAEGPVTDLPTDLTTVP